MRNNETGEFELVVGNKQLLSGFFIVVLLFAVAFAMGYVVGQNTQRPAKLASDSGAASGALNSRRGFPSSTFIAGCRGGRAARAGASCGHATAPGLDASAHHATCPGDAARGRRKIRGGARRFRHGRVIRIARRIVLAGDRGQSRKSPKPCARL